MLLRTWGGSVIFVLKYLFKRFSLVLQTSFLLVRFQYLLQYLMLHFIGPFLHLEASHTCQSSDKSHLLQFSWVYFLFPLQHFWAHQSVNHESLSQGELMSFYWTYNSHCQCSMYHFPPAYSVPEFVILGKRSQSFANLFHLAAGQQQLFWILEQWGQILTQSSRSAPCWWRKRIYKANLNPWTQVHLDSPLLQIE